MKEWDVDERYRALMGLVKEMVDERSQNQDASARSADESSRQSDILSLGGVESADLNALVNNFISENFEKLASPEKKVKPVYA